MKLEKSVRHLLVDLDGTLLGNRPVPLSLDFVAQALRGFRERTGSWGKGVRALWAIRREFETPSRERPNDVRVVEAVARRMNVGMEEARLFLRESVARIFPSLKRHFYPMPGALEFLEWAKGRYVLTLATNPVWPAEIARLRLEWAGIDPTIFGHVTDVRIMHACKPKREYYEEILQQLGASADDCLLIGNELKMDLPATRVGIPVFIVGNFEKCEPFSLKEARARAWRGRFEHLRAALEMAAASARAEA